MTARPIIIDCDPGQDDAIALLLALASPELEIVAVTTVAGNVTLDLTTRNALAILELAGRPEIVVHAGADRPLAQKLLTAGHVHGETGLAGLDLPLPTHPPAPGHAADLLIQATRDRPGLTLCPLGPLTNVATALKRDPGLGHRLQEIVLMGGAIGHGNVTTHAEFNMRVDPEAAAIVFESGVPITMIGLDATRQALATPERVEALKRLGTTAALAAASVLAVHAVAQPLHDPCVIAYLLQPALFRARPARVVVETEDTITLGRTRVEFDSSVPNARVADAVDADRFFALLFERLGR